jgi:hypothetical protein
MGLSTSQAIELCSINSIVSTVNNFPATDLSHALLACDMPVKNGASLSSLEPSSCPELQSILHEFKDVLVPSIPGGLPPARFDNNGRAIEHTIETAPDAIPYDRPPGPFTQEDQLEYNLL